MDQQNSHEYYVARAAAARALAEAAVDRGVAAIHAEMAARYDEMASRQAQNGGKILRIVQAA